MSHFKNHVGKAIPHESAKLHVSGEALYTDDLSKFFPKLLHAFPVQAPYSHAKVLKIDSSEALNVQGIVKVLSAEDVLGVNDSGIHHDEALFPSEVTFHGQAVVWVLAENETASAFGSSGGQG
ncbi:MAG: hypothetical protein R2865_06245 [Deinococcales bacterium]